MSNLVALWSNKGPFERGLALRRRLKCRANNLKVRRPQDTAGFCDALKSCRNIYAVTKNVMRLNNYVADIDTHTESNAPVFHVTDCKFLSTGLEQHRGPNRFDRTRKLRQGNRQTGAIDCTAVRNVRAPQKFPGIHIGRLQSDFSAAKLLRF